MRQSQKIPKRTAAPKRSFVLVWEPKPGLLQIKAVDKNEMLVLPKSWQMYYPTKTFAIAKLVAHAVKKTSHKRRGNNVVGLQLQDASDQFL